MDQNNYFMSSQCQSTDFVYSTVDNCRNAIPLWLGTSNASASSEAAVNNGNDSNSHTIRNQQDESCISKATVQKCRPKWVYENKPAEVITPEQHQLSIKDSPSYYLGLLINSHALAWLLDETNLHGKNMKNFTPVTEDEMRCFIAILYLSGYIGVPRRRMLWERSPDTHCALVSNAMQRDRFESIFSAIHMDALKSDVRSLNRIQPFVNLLNEKFLHHVPSDNQHSLIQCTIPAFSRYQNSNNSSKALKVWCACTKIGYCTWFAPVPSSLNANESNVDPQSVILHYAGVAQQVHTGITSLLIDNCYVETPLLYELRKLGIQGSGADREKSGSFLNPTLGGVDKLDSNINLYRISMHGKKTYSAVLTYCLDLALNNAWYLYKINTKDKKPLDLLGFRRNIVIYYLQHYAKPIINRKGGRSIKLKYQGKKRTPSDARFDGIRHYVIPQLKQTRCGKCSMKTTTRCQKCDVGVHVKCFVDFHTRPKQLVAIIVGNGK